MGALNLGIFSALQGVAERQRQRKAQSSAEQMMLEDRIAGQQDRQRRQQLEDAVQARSTEQYDYAKSQRPLEERLKEAQIGQVQARANAASHPKPRQIPSGAIEKEIGVDNMLSQAEGVRASLQLAKEAGTNATGTFLGMKTPTRLKNMVGMGGEEGQRVRNIIGSLKSTIAKERAGTSMTPGELDLLESYIPSDNDDESVALSKAEDFIKALHQVKANRKKAYSRYGYSMDEGEPESDGDQLPFSEY